MSGRRSKYFQNADSSVLPAVTSQQQSIKVEIKEELVNDEEHHLSKSFKIENDSPRKDTNNNRNSSQAALNHNHTVKKALSQSGDEISSLSHNKKLKTRDLPEVKAEINVKISPDKASKSNSVNGNLNAINAITDATLLCYEKPRMLTRLAKKLMEQAGGADVPGCSKAQSRNVSTAPVAANRNSSGNSSSIQKVVQSNVSIGTLGNGVEQKNIARKSLPKDLSSAGEQTQGLAQKQTKTQAKPRSTTPRSKGRPKKEITFPEVSSPSATSSNAISLSSLGSGGTSAMPAEFSSPEYVRERLEMVPFKAPKDWQKVLNNTRQMRFQAGNAPVDDFGPMRWMIQTVNNDNELDDVQLNLCRFRVIVCLILSIRGRDKTVNSVMEELGGDSITPQSILAMPHSTLVEKIRPVGLQETKANYLRQTSRMIIEKYKMIIPNNMEDLYALPGIDNKCGVLALHIGFNKDCGIAVDTHVHRIANRLGWANSNNPRKTMMQLQDWMPREEWGKLNHLLVGFGQLICTPKNPSCQNCLNSSLCPFGRERLKNLNF